MSRILKRNRLALAVCVAVVCGISGLFLYRTHSVPAPSVPYLAKGTVNFGEAEGYWEARIREIGASAAYAEFTKVGETLSPYQAHVLAHAFGGALYVTKGLEGFPICTDVFVEGCAHQFVGAAIVDQGIGIVRQLYVSCQGNGILEWACSHSIGHGLVGYFGYSLSDLEQVLGLCDSLDPSPRGGCTDAAFMEYNLRFLAELSSSGQSEPRPLSVQDRYSPCTAVEEKYRLNCFVELPAWWIDTMTNQKTTLDQRAAQLGRYCSDVQDIQERRACFEGVGVVTLAMGNDDETRAYAFCAVSTSDPLEQLFCLTGIVRHAHIAGRTGFAGICDQFDLPETSLRYCRAYASADLGNVSALPIPNVP